METFLQNFSLKSYEFCLTNNGEITKILSNPYIHEADKKLQRKENISRYFVRTFPQHKGTLKSIFSLESSLLFHIGIDSLGKRAKLYISLYDISFPTSIKIITSVRKILGIQDPYKLEKNFVQFDCIGIDFTDTDFDLKIYELIESQCMYDGIPDFVSQSDIKQVGYLKSSSGRKKKFFRFLHTPPLSAFESLFDTSGIDIFQEKIKNFYTLQKLVKYYCIEGEKKEIYFI